MSLLARVGAFLKRPLRRDDLVTVTNLNGETRTGMVSGWARNGWIYLGGQKAPHIHGHSSYSIETKDGWWVNIAQGRIQDWSVRPTIGACVFYTGKLGGALRGYGRVR